MTVGTAGRLYSHFFSRTDRLVSKYSDTITADSGPRSSYTEIHKDFRFFCVIRLQHLWGEFCRELLVRSSIGGFYTIGGTQLPQVVGISHPRDVDRVAQQTLGRYTIAWHVPQLAGRIARTLSPANVTQIVTALSSTSPIDDIRTIRNHIVHPNAGTRSRYSAVARRYGVFDSDPDAILSAKISPGNITRFEYWIIQLQAIALNAGR